MQGFDINADKNYSQEELGIILITCPDVPENKLIPLVKKLIQKSYPNLPAYDDVFEIYQQLSRLDVEALARMFFDLLNNESLRRLIKSYITEKQFPDEYIKNEILYFILESLYQAPPKQLNIEEIINYIKKLDIK